MRGIKDKVVFITGGEKGLGKATGQRFAEEGAKVVIYGIDEVEGTKTAQELNEITEGAMYIKGNVLNNEELEAAMNKIIEVYGKLDFAVNSAGVTGDIKNVLETSEEEFDFVMNVNTKGVFLSMKNQIKVMKDKKFGKIVNISSAAGLVAIGSLTPYTTSKFAVVGMTKAAAIEYALNGITINAVAPGTIMTPMVAALPQEVTDSLIATHPVKRLMNVDKVAAACVYLCSEDSDDTTGSVVSIDGGYTAH
jgi:NAD(P)-dependent dehydrogenase (short-subunit alcohol dehydrogenase family)